MLNRVEERMWIPEVVRRPFRMRHSRRNTYPKKSVAEEATCLIYPIFGLIPLKHGLTVGWLEVNCVDVGDRICVT